MNKYPSPSAQEATDLHSIHHFIWLYHQGELSAEDAAKVEMLIKTDPRAASSSCACLAANAKLSTEEDQARAAHEKAAILRALDKCPPISVSRKPADQRFAAAWFEQSPSSSFFTRLSDWLTDLFGTGLLNESYAADATDDQIVKSFPAASGEPFEAELVKDGVGRWFLRVFTKDASAAANVLAVDMEREAPVLRFAPVSETLFEAEVRISETMAQALSAGHRPVFRPAE